MEMVNSIFQDMKRNLKKVKSEITAQEQKLWEVLMEEMRVMERNMD